MTKLGNIMDEMFDNHMEVAARVAERTGAFDDATQRAAGCMTTGERVAARIRELKLGNEHHKWMLENEPHAFDLAPSSPGERR